MAIDQKFIDLINADIDGEIQGADKAELDAFLAESTEGRALRADLRSLSGSLDALEEVEPPPHLKHVILNSIPPQAPEQQRIGIIQTILASPVLRYAASFAAGALLMLSIVGSDRIHDSAFDDMSGLVGTMTDPADLGPADDKIAITENDVAGTISLRSSGSLLVLDFDLVAGKEIDIVADYTDRTIWFNGFAQLESSGTSVSADTGRVTLRMEGKRRYAVFLHNEGDRETQIDLKFLSGNDVLHQASLTYGGADQ